MTDRRDPRDPFPPLPSAGSLRIDPSEIDWSKLIEITGGINLARSGAGQVIWMRAGDITLVPSILFQTGDATVNAPALTEIRDLGGGVWGLMVAGPRTAAGNAAVIYLRSDNSIGVEVAGSEVARFTADGLITGPLGVLGYAQVTTNQESITADTDLTGLSVTVDVAPGRRIRIIGTGGFTVSAVSRWIVSVMESTTEVGRAMDESFGQAGLFPHFYGGPILTPSAGSHTYHLRADEVTGTATATLAASATFPVYILVEDIGPV